jgi:hypothetical protein
MPEKDISLLLEEFGSPGSGAGREELLTEIARQL